LPFLSSRPCFAFTGSFGVLILQTMLPWIQTGSYPAGQADAGCARAAKPPIATTAAISFDFMGALLWVRDASASPTVGRAVRLKGSTRFGPKRAVRRSPGPSPPRSPPRERSLLISYGPARDRNVGTG